jgi:hypothetical protein
MVSGTKNVKELSYANIHLSPTYKRRIQFKRRVSDLKDQHLKTMIGEDRTLHLSIWHNGTKEALLMHVGSTLDTIKKQGISETTTKPRSST